MRHRAVTKASERSFSGANWLWPLFPVTGAERQYLLALVIGLVPFHGMSGTSGTDEAEIVNNFQRYSAVYQSYHL